MLAGKWALVCGANKGLGLAWVVRRRWCVKGERSRGGLRRSGLASQCCGGRARAACRGRHHHRAEACRRLCRAAGLRHRGPPPDDFRQFDTAAWQQAVQANMLIPIELIRASITDMA